MMPKLHNSPSFGARIFANSTRLVTLLLFLTFAFSAPGVLAQNKSKKKKTKITVAMSQQVFEKLQAAQELLEAEDYDAALQLVNAMRNTTSRRKKKLSVYETAQTWNLTAYIYYLKEDYRGALNAYNKVLEQSEIPEALIQSTLKTVAQLYFTQDDYRSALKVVKKLIAMLESPAADVYMLLGQAYFQLDEFKNALGPIKKAISLYRSQGKKPRENWLLLLRVIYHRQENYSKMLEVLKELIDLYPKDQYLLTMAGVYSELEDTEAQLAITETLYDKGLITSPSQISNLANLFMLHGVPYKAAALLEKEINQLKRVKGTERNYRTLSQAWYQAREDAKSIPPMRKAAEMSEDGEMYMRLAQAHLNLDQWDPAAKAVRNALKKGGLKRVDTANIMLGMALFNLKRLELARDTFQKAAKDKRSRKVATQWVAYMNSEIKREKILAEG